MSSNKDYYYLKNELNSIKFILIVIILIYYLFTCFSFFFLPKNIFHHNWRAWLKVVFWVTDSNQEWAVVLLNKLSL